MAQTEMEQHVLCEGRDCKNTWGGLRDGFVGAIAGMANTPLEASDLAGSGFINSSLTGVDHTQFNDAKLSKIKEGFEATTTVNAGSSASVPATNSIQIQIPPELNDLYQAYNDYIGMNQFKTEILVAIILLFVFGYLIVIGYWAAGVSGIILYGVLMGFYINAKMGKISMSGWPPNMNTCPDYFYQDRVDGNNLTCKTPHTNIFTDTTQQTITFDMSKSVKDRCNQAASAGLYYSGCV
jgi:hypothetical protein